MGIPLSIAFLYVSGITGYWLVWDKLAQYVATTSTELLDWMPIFGKPITAGFEPTSLSDRFFTLLVFLHIAVPIVLLFVMWIHIQRISRPKVNPPRLLGGIVLVSLLIVTLAMPALSQGPANLGRCRARCGSIPGSSFSIRSPSTRAGLGLGGHDGDRPAAVDRAVPAAAPHAGGGRALLDHCNGCGRCVDDCPYEALRLTRRTDGAVYLQEAIVDASKCVSCGICVRLVSLVHAVPSQPGSGDRHRPAGLSARAHARGP